MTRRIIPIASVVFLALLAMGVDRVYNLRVFDGPDNLDLGGLAPGDLDQVRRRLADAIMTLEMQGDTNK